MSRSTRIIYLVLFLVAFGAKLVYLHERSSWPDFAHPTLDAKYHDDWAMAIASGDWDGRVAEIETSPYFRAPLYPYFVGWVYKVFGHSYYTIRFVQCLIGALSALLIYRLTSLLFGRRAALLAFFLYLAYWPVTYFEGELLIPVLIVALDLLAIVLLIEAGRIQKGRKEKTLWLAAGLTLGLSALARPNVLIVIPFLVLWVWKRARRLQPVMFVLVACVAAILPVTVRNAVVGKDFVPIASQGGVNFFIGNNSEADGVRAVVPGTRADWWGGFDDANRIAEDALGGVLKPSQISNYWFGEGLTYLVKEPRDAARLYARKIMLFLGNGEVSNNQQLYFVKRRSLVLSLMAVNFALLFAFGLAGSLIRNHDGAGSLRIERPLPLLFIVPYAVSVIVFFVTSRYRLPVSVLLVPYAAYGIIWIYERFRRGDTRRAALYTAVVVAVFAASLANPLGVGAAAEARGFYALGVDYSRSDYTRALEAFDESIARDGSFAPAWKMRGWAKYKLGQHDAAIADLREAVRLDSNFVDALFVLGVVYQVRDRHDDAAQLYERAIALEPTHKGALTNLADVYMRQGSYDAALPLLQRALEIDGAFPNAIFGLGSYYEHVGRAEDAAAEYKRILHLPAGRLGLTRLMVKQGQLDEAAAALKTWALDYPDAGDIPALTRLVEDYRKRHSP